MRKHGFCEAKVLSGWLKSPKKGGEAMSSYEIYAALEAFAKLVTYIVDRFSCKRK